MGEFRKGPWVTKRVNNCFIPNILKEDIVIVILSATKKRNKNLKCQDNKEYLLSL